MTSNAATGDSRGLVRLIDEQIELYTKLDGLSRKQHECVEADDTDGLLTVLGERQQLIVRITDASARMSPYRAQWDAHVGGLGEEDRARIRQGLDDLSALMGIIAARPTTSQPIRASLKNHCAKGANVQVIKNRRTPTKTLT